MNRRFVRVQTGKDNLFNKQSPAVHTAGLFCALFPAGGGTDPEPGSASFRRRPERSTNEKSTQTGAFQLVGLVGLEPMTPTMSTWCSNQLSYNPETLTSRSAKKSIAW